MSDKILCGHDDPTWCTDKCLTKKDFRPKEINKAMTKDQAEEKIRRWDQVCDDAYLKGKKIPLDYVVQLEAVYAQGVLEGHASRDTEVAELVKALEQLSIFNRELCEDVHVSTHYPSAEKANELIAKHREKS